MSSSMVCPRFHSLPEPNLANPLPQFPNSPPMSSDFHHQNNKKTETSRDVNGDSSTSSSWTFNFLTNPSQKKNKSNVTETQNENNVYVHPLAKRSASALSKKSLEMCTESLGSETGSEISDAADELCSPPARNTTTQRPKPRDFAKKLTFPPPLTSISGSDGVRVTPHRENGRLVIEAVAVSSCGSFFQAERADGRLRLCLVKNADIEEEEEAESDDVANGCDDVEGVDENSGTFGYEIKIGEIPRPSRCYESGFERKGIQSWGAVWVAIS